MNAADYLTASRFSGQPRGEHTAPADQAYELADRMEAAHRFAPALTSNDDFVGPLIPWGESPRSPQMVREWWLAWWELQRVVAKRRAQR